MLNKVQKTESLVLNYCCCSFIGCVMVLVKPMNRHIDDDSLVEDKDLELEWLDKWAEEQLQVGVILRCD